VVLLFSFLLTSYITAFNQKTKKPKKKNKIGHIIIYFTSSVLHSTIFCYSFLSKSLIYYYKQAVLSLHSLTFFCHPAHSARHEFTKFHLVDSCFSISSKETNTVFYTYTDVHWLVFAKQKSF